MRNSAASFLRALYCAALCGSPFAVDAMGAGMLRAELTPLTARPRSQAPQFMDIKLIWRGAGLLEGALEIAPTGNGVEFVYRTDDLILSPGAQSRRLLLPWVGMRWSGFPDARICFRTSKGVVDLGEQPIGTSTLQGRTMTICVSKGSRREREDEMPLWQSLRLERFAPDGKNSSLPAIAAVGPRKRPTGVVTRVPIRGAYSPPLSTLPVVLPAEDLPTRAIGYCAFDIVLLEEEGFSLLGAKQLEALEQWAEGGGSICVIAEGVLKPQQAKFLDAFGIQASPPYHASVDRGVELPPGRKVVMQHIGLGRLVLAASRPTAIELETPEWRRAVAFLWKICAGQLKSVADSGEWTLDETFNLREQDNVAFLIGERLVPRSVRMVPWPVLVLILALFVVLVGPADYLLLGRLKAHRFTWLVFPAVCIAMTLCTLWLSERYMRSNNFRGALIINDIGPNKRLCRQSRFELIFAAREQEVITSVRNALCVPFESSSMIYSPQNERFAGTYVGQFPALYELRQRIPQWCTQINRITSLEPSNDSSAIRWEMFHPPTSPVWPAVSVLIEGMRISPTADVYVLRGSKVETAFLGSDYADESRDAWRRLVEQLSIRRGGGIFSILTTLSPNGLAGFDDLRVLDPTDPTQALVVVLQRQGDNFVVHRRLYH